MQLLVIQHDHASPLGPVAERFVERGFDLTMHAVVPESSFLAPGVETDFPDFTRFDAVVSMGAPWSAYDESIDSWVRPEIEQLRRADEAGVPVFGICFGGQLLAATHGGAVIPSSTPEIGWAEVCSDDDALVPSGPWFQWHYDRWELPHDAHEVARNAAVVAGLHPAAQPRRAVPPRADQHHARRLARQRWVREGGLCGPRPGRNF